MSCHHGVLLEQRIPANLRYRPSLGEVGPLVGRRPVEARLVIEVEELTAVSEPCGVSRCHVHVRIIR
jgi:hypothetical protein